MSEDIFGRHSYDNAEIMVVLVRLDERSMVMEQHLARLNGRLDRGESRLDSLEATRDRQQGAGVIATGTWRALLGLATALGAGATITATALAWLVR